MIITVDCGTTNMRCRLFDGKNLIDQERAKCGIRDGAFLGSTDILKETLAHLIKTLLERNLLTESDIEVVISTGTLASDVGIFKIPHAICPAWIPESVKAAEMTVMEEVTKIPILFIPGVKTLPADDADLETNAILKQQGQSTTLTVEQCRQNALMMPNAWMYWFLDYDPTADIAATKCPIFALNGDKDLQVLSSLNLTAIKQTLPQNEEYTNLNHLFQHCQTGLPTEYNGIEETISEEVLRDITVWILALP